MRLLKNNTEALEKYLFYRSARDLALEVLKAALVEYRTAVRSDELESFEDELELLYNELELANKAIDEVSLVH